MSVHDHVHRGIDERHDGTCHGDADAFECREHVYAKVWLGHANGQPREGLYILLGVVGCPAFGAGRLPGDEGGEVFVDKGEVGCDGYNLGNITLG